MKLRIELTGNMQAEADRASMNLRRAMYFAMRRRGNALKARLRKDVEKSRIKNAVHVAKTWRGTLYPKKFNGTANPAYLIANKAPWVFESLEHGPLIRARGNGALLIPIGEAAQLDLPLFTSRASLVQRMRSKYGQLRVRVSSRTREAMLGAYVSDGRRGQRFIPLFLLRRQVKAPDRLNAEGILAKFQSRFAEDYAGDVSRTYEALQAKRAKRR